MIEYKTLEKQLKKINFNPNGWGRSEVRELCNILLPDEEVEECVNGYYEAGFALLVATKHRVLLVDKKPLNYLTVEDIRFDMISEFDYSHRIIGAHASISSGYKTLEFTSLNQPRLRSLLTYVQTRMTEMKQQASNHQETQKQHLESMNKQLREYLLSAQRQSLAQQQAALQQQQAAQSVQQVTSEQPLPPVPQPALYTPRPLASSTSFEEAAAASMSYESEEPVSENQAVPTATPTPAEESAASTPYYRRIIITPQQLGVAAARRVVPVIRAYSRVPMLHKPQRLNQHDTAAGAA